ncbi:hypothetical protein [Aquicella lusitana]|uniref:Lipoprotein n=1 Tax=Aquicella lusitana TaxID=254246 RepID=A0A370GGN6_9COXI|nr:hypothetical protein [Aquicella lusitana]RDI42821.1 hypothetical protein C8D86_11218 [Aquicella lusitana]VVC73064.1 hypothetical protein AQULUS_07950 [Aquicella lusitana]
MKLILNVLISVLIFSGLSGCSTATKQPSSASYQPGYGYVRPAYSYPQYRYYPASSYYYEYHLGFEKKRVR